jgi:hypothetical protein
MREALLDFDLKSAHIRRLRGASSKRPGLQFNLSVGTHLGVRNLAPKTCRAKGNIMQLPKLLQGESLTRLLQGAFAGFLATVVIGFGWGGWMLGSTAKKMADQSTNSAIVAALAPICVEKFQHATEAKATLAQLKLIDSWKQDSFIEKGGWATFPGTASPNNNVAEACAKMLNELK